MRKNTHPGAGSGLMSDMTASAAASSAELDSLFRKLFPRAPRPATFQERNERIYARLGYVPGRDHAH